MKLILFDNQSWQHRTGKIRFADSKITKVGKKNPEIPTVQIFNLLV